MSVSIILLMVQKHPRLSLRKDKSIISGCGECPVHCSKRETWVINWYLLMEQLKTINGCTYFLFWTFIACVSSWKATRKVLNLVIMHCCTQVMLSTDKEKQSFWQNTSLSSLLITTWDSVFLQSTFFKADRLYHPWYTNTAHWTCVGISETMGR